MRFPSLRTRRILPIRRWLVLWLGLGFELTGCGGTEVPTFNDPQTDATQLFAALQIDKRGITMSTVAPYDTLQIFATPFDLTGQPMPGLPAPVFLSSDTTVVQVTPEGELRAVGTGNRIRVTATLTAPGNVAHADTAFVTVTASASPPRLANLSIHAVPPDSVVVPLITVAADPFWPTVTRYKGSLNTSQIAARKFPKISAIDSTGAAMSGLSVALVALDPTVAALYAGAIGDANGIKRNIAAVGDQTILQPLKPGQARLVAQTTAYGITMADTVVWWVTWPTVGALSLMRGTPRFTGDRMVLAPSAVVELTNLLDDTVAIIFDDSTNVLQPPVDVCNGFTKGLGAFLHWYDTASPHCGAGNVILPGIYTGGDLFFLDGSLVPHGSATYSLWSHQLRQFVVPGVYHFHSSTGATGQIIVTTNPDGTFP